MTTCARAAARVESPMRGALGVAVGTTFRCTAVMRRMAARACSMILRREHGLVLMAARTGRRRIPAEIVRGMAARAARVPRRQRAWLDAHRATLGRMAARASSICCELALVHGVTIEAATRARVRCRVIAMARLTALRLQRRRCVRAMAITTGLLRVRADRRVRALILGVAAHAVLGKGLAIGAEAVAVLASRGHRCARRRVVDVEWRRHRAVTAFAEISCWAREPIVVAVRTRHAVLRDMCHVARALTNELPRLGDARWHPRLRVPTGAADEEQHDDEAADHRVAPSG